VISAEKIKGLPFKREETFVLVLLGANAWRYVTNVAECFQCINEGS